MIPKEGSAIAEFSVLAMVLWKKPKRTDDLSEAGSSGAEGSKGEEPDGNGPPETMSPNERTLPEVEARKGDGLLALPGEVRPEVAPNRGGRWLRRVLPGIAVAGGVGALEVVRQRFQHSQTFLPDRYPNGIWDPKPYGVINEDKFFASEDGTALHGWWIPVRRARGTVIYCHGNSGNITNRIGVFRYLQRLRLNVFAFDYRGYGRSEGEPSEEGVYADARAAHDFVTGELQEEPERLLIFGHSLGGAIAIDMVTHRRAAGLVAQSTFTNLREMARARFPSMPMHLVASNRFRSIDKVGSLELPKLFVHGTADETVPYHIGERLYERAADPKEWYSVPHAGHNDVYRFGGFRYLWKVSRFARRCLGSSR